jgi:hypothetical protein
MTTTNTTFIIYDTAGQAISAIQPNTLDGPGGVQQNSDLEMYGLGFPNWGEGVNQNDYRLCENFACPQVAGSDPPVPQNSTQLGAGNGINHPIVGQVWFNTTNQQLYVYTEPSPNNFTWALTAPNPVATTSTAPLNPSTGSLWYNPAIPQLEIWNGTSWVSVAAMYLPLSGGTMSGGINMNNQTLTNVPTPVNAGDGVNKAYVDNQVAGVSGFVAKTGDTMTGTLTMSNTGITIQNGILNLTGNSGITVSSTGILSFGNQRLQNVGYPASSNDAVTVTWATGNLLSKSGGTLTGPLNMGSNTLTGVPTPVNTTDGVNKAYVDTSISTAISGNTGSGSLAPNGYWTLPGGLTIQWGSFGAGSYASTQTIYFPKAFPTHCAAVTTSQADNISYGYTSEVSSVSTSYFTFIPQNKTVGYTIYWIAIGY